MRIYRAHPDGVARCRRVWPGQRSRLVDLGGQRIQRPRRKKALRIGGLTSRVGDHALAHPEGSLGRLDQAVQVGKALALLHTKAVK